ncbi:girdin-like isoform X2 [Osmerus eperlanus]|uniref:girdin-like isoform X2 n=1 Tax=Osmerus eperlanus TaxID=29151 RepID=UPI002E1396E5
MESEVFPTYLKQFMLSPLVTWVKTFGPIEGTTQLDYSELLDGVFLNEIMNEINPKSSLECVNKVNMDSVQRIQNLAVLIRQIKMYYLENLRQLIVIPPPNVLLLGKSPHSEQGLEEMKKVLLLLLGCAVQCEKKEEYIERIQTLDFDTKAAIAVHIQEVTHCEDSVLDLHWLESSGLHPDDLETVSRNMALHLRRLVEQRDSQLESIVELMLDRESPPPSPPGAQSPSEGPSVHQQQPGAHQHLAVELADAKAKIRRLRQELEEKSEQVLDGRQELENTEADLKRLQHENASLLADARAARAYRDELDALRERAIRADKLESELGRTREKLHNMEFYKTKVEELKEDNQVLLETKAVLEEQVEGWRTRSDKLHQLEKHSLLLKARVHDMEQEKEVDRRRVEELQEENLALCLAQRRSMEESQHLGWELEQLSKSPDNTESQKSLSEEVSEKTRSRLLKLEKENRSLLRTIEDLKTVCGLRPHHDRNHPAADIYGSTQSTSSFEHPLLARNETRDFAAMDEGDSSLSNTLALQRAHDDDESEAEIARLERESETLEEKMDPRDQEKGQLEEEGDLKDLTPDLEAPEKGSPHCSPCSKNSSPLWGSLANRSPYSSKHTERLQAKCGVLDTENQRLQAALDNTGRKLQRVEAEVQELEAENQALQAGLEELRISSRRLEQLEVESRTLEQEASGLERDKRRLEKDNRRLKQQAEIQDATLDAANVRVASLERDARALGKEAEGLRETSERVKALERDNRELAKQTAIDHRTLATLREELVSEKLKSQQRENELERLAHQLELKVFNLDSPASDEETPESSRFKMLESELESSLKRSLQIKEDKMAALEARLQESSTLNQQLRQELKTVRLNYEALQQRNEEERADAGSAPQRESGRAASEWQRESQEATRELLRVKDRLIEVERNNATLQAERQAQQAQRTQQEAQSEGLQAQILALQRQTASLQENNTALQTHNANLQVEKSTLNSQSASLLAQNAQLQRQQSAAEGEREGAAREREEARGVHEQLLRDHERLAALHERQAQECEALMGKHGGLKHAHRSLELEHRTLQDRYNTLLQQRARLEGLEKALREEQEKMALEKEQHRTTASECRRLRDEKDWLNQTYRQLVKDNEELQADHKNLKTLLNSTKLDQTRLESDFSKLKDQYQQLDITSTKLTNQCELLRQVKGNLEEENRHLLDQIQTLMLQNRTLLEQTMESKDLFHVEQRQYIDKLNELRRQKEKLEEKIMDQYKFYDPSPPRRRGNWITLKMRKLMKPRSRERGSERTPGSPPPTRSASREGPPGGPVPSSCRDDGSFVGSGGSASTSVTDALSPRRRSSNKDSNDSAVPSGFDDNDDLQNHGLNGVGSRAQSESSGEFSLSLDNEPWSNGSSPIQHPPSRRSSSCQPPSDASTPRNGRPAHRDKASKGSSLPMPIPTASTPGVSHSAHKPTEAGNGDVWPCRRSVIRRGSGGKIARRSSAVETVGGKPVKGPPGKPEQTPPRASACSAITVLYVQGKSSSTSGCLNCFSAPLGKDVRLRGLRPPSTLPRASSVISTAEGSSRRSSVNSDCRVAGAKVDLAISPANGIQEIEDCGEDSANRDERRHTGLKEPVPPVKPPRDPAVAAAESELKASCVESLFGSPFDFTAVFSDTIFREAAAATHAENEKNQTFLSLNPSLVRNISCPPLRQESTDDTAQPEDQSQTAQNQNGRHDCENEREVSDDKHFVIA